MFPLRVGEDRYRLTAGLCVQLGTPTVLINNAATVSGKRFLDLTMKEVER